MYIHQFTISNKVNILKSTYMGSIVARLKKLQFLNIKPKNFEVMDLSEFLIFFEYNTEKTY